MQANLQNKNNMSKKSLFEEFKSGDLNLNNRIVMAPMTRARSANEGNVATELTATYYAQRATAGLIITEGTFISEEAIGFINVPGIYTKPQIEGWKTVTKAVHEKNGKIYAQLWHTGSSSHPDLHEGRLPLAPSAINPESRAFTPDGFKPTVTPQPMTLDDIKRTIQDFKNGAINAFEAGFDGVELHAANGYLLQQFFSKSTNNRTDEYGGSIENRARILFDILDAIQEIADIKKVGVRLNPSLDGATGVKIDEETIPTYDYIVNRLNEYDLAYVHFLEPFTDVSANEKAVKEVAKYYRKIYNGTLIINKGFNKETATQVLEDGYADLVSFGVPFIANPDLVERYKTDAPLNTPDQDTFYVPGEKGYTDYPFLNQ